MFKERVNKKKIEARFKVLFFLAYLALLLAIVTVSIQTLAVWSKAMCRDPGFILVDPAILQLLELMHVALLCCFVG